MDNEDITNFLYRLHFPCTRKRCKCDKIIKDAINYLNESVIKVKERDDS